MKNHILSYIHILGILFFLGSLTSCKTENYSDLKVQDTLLVQLDSLIQQVDTLQYKVQKNADNKAIQNQFFKTRISFKKMEWAIEYFTPDPARFINGPALDELEVEENKFLSPNGFQFIEEFLFPNLENKNREEVKREIAMLRANLNQVKNHLKVITISNDYVIDGLRSEILRIMALGITGFDSPIALHSIPEIAPSLQSVAKVLKSIDSKNSIEITNIEKLVKNATQYSKTNNDFDTFDRMHFIVNYLNPITKELNSFIKKAKINFPNRNNALNPDITSFFETNTFNVNAFIPSKEFKFSKEKAALGNQLFYDTSISKNKDRSCATCHNPQKAFTDGLKTNQSLTGFNLARNTPSLNYAGFQNAQFWDMRQPDLEKQSQDVIQNKDEMHGNLENSIPTLMQNKKYQMLFERAFPKEQKMQGWHLQNALASYTRSLPKFNSKFDEYMQGKSTLTSAEIAGFNLFAGKAKCATCHFIPLFNGTVPPNFRKTEQEIIGTPQTILEKEVSRDLGRYSQYKMPQLLHSFKTPTLRNIELTSPYMHNGVYTTLEEVVDFYNKGGGIGLGYEVENQTLPSDKLNLNETEKQNLIAFLKTLSDKI